LSYLDQVVAALADVLAVLDIQLFIQAIEEFSDRHKHRYSNNTLLDTFEVESRICTSMYLHPNKIQLNMFGTYKQEIRLVQRAEDNPIQALPKNFLHRKMVDLLKYLLVFAGPMAREQL
jgi:hypothetical protein